MGEGRKLMVAIEETNLITDYEQVRKRIISLKEGQVFSITVPVNPDIVIDNRIRDKVLYLMTLAEKHKVKSRLWENKLNNTYVLSFKK